MTDNQTIPACDLCTVVLVVDHDPAGRTVIRAAHQPGCPDATPTADVAKANA